ncbi:uncharacterized protein LOC125856734 [Solanum stenotomum]|uniref:uncharacterized protein LOC125856734 n=1 Tax=Solanum stenotomum TaxID=172797 RepID=UPI0020D0D0D3|nr:uncharacterized protein LOC125856734 [Solanum stenotomum]
MARYAPSFVDTMHDRVRRFVGGLNSDYIEACFTAALNDNRDISWIQAFAQGIEDRRHLQYTSERVERERQKRARPTGSGEDSRASGLQQQRGFGQARTSPSCCITCGRMHFGRCRKGSTSCYSCGQEGHGWRNCPTIGQGGTGQSTRSTVGSSSSSAQSTGRGPHTSARRGRGGGRKGASNFGSGQNHTYSFTGRQDSESSPDVEKQFGNGKAIQQR